MVEFLQATWQVMLELSPWLLLGAAIGGLLHVLLPRDFLRRQFSGPGGVPKAVILGVPLPLCSCGVIPVGMQLKKGGADDGAVVAFLISTPQTGVDSVFVSASMLGWPFAIFKVISAGVTGIVGGWLANAVAEPAPAALPAVAAEESTLANPWQEFWQHSLMLVQSIWGWLVFGVLASAAIDVFVPADALQGLSAYGGLAAMLVALLVSVPLYVCAVASVPIAAALVASGLPVGAALVFLMAGPATNVATLGAVYRTLGLRTLGVYLGTIIVLSVLSGWAFSFVVDASTVTVGHDHLMQNWWSIASAVVLTLLLGRFALQDARRRWMGTTLDSSAPHLDVSVTGMTCDSCVAKLESTLKSDELVDAVAVSLHPGRARVQGEISEGRVRQLIQAAGFQAGVVAGDTDPNPRDGH